MPNAARVYDYFLGGGFNGQADRDFAREVMAQVPEAPAAARSNRAFLRRAVRFALSQGVTQFLDLGCGLPTVGAVHEIAQQVNPDARVLYVDSDPVVVEYCRHLRDHPVDGARVCRADLVDADAVFAAAGRWLNLDEPVAVLMIAVLHFVADGPELDKALDRYIDTMVSGSLLAISHATTDADPDRLGEAAKLYESSSTPFVTRSYEQIEALFRNTALVDPGLVWTPLWHPEPGDDIDDVKTSAFYAGVGQVSVAGVRL